MMSTGNVKNSGEAHAPLLAGLVPEPSKELLPRRAPGLVPAACRGQQRGVRAAAGSVVPAGSGAAFPLSAWRSISPGATSELLFWVCNGRRKQNKLCRARGPSSLAPGSPHAAASAAPQRSPPKPLCSCRRCPGLTDTSPLGTVASTPWSGDGPSPSAPAPPGYGCRCCPFPFLSQSEICPLQKCPWPIAPHPKGTGAHGDLLSTGGQMGGC